MGAVSMWPVGDPESDQGGQVSVLSLGPLYLFLLWPLRKLLSDEWTPACLPSGF